MLFPAAESSFILKRKPAAGLKKALLSIRIIVFKTKEREFCVPIKEFLKQYKMGVDPHHRCSNPYAEGNKMAFQSNL